MFHGRCLFPNVLLLCCCCLYLRDTKKGDKYAIWKLSDLSSQTAVISLFLFGKSYQEHWKTSVGTVVALLNPNVMPGKEVRTHTHTSDDKTHTLKVRKGAQTDRHNRHKPLCTSRDSNW